MRLRLPYQNFSPGQQYSLFLSLHKKCAVWVNYYSLLVVILQMTSSILNVIRAWTEYVSDNPTHQSHFKLSVSTQLVVTPRSSQGVESTPRKKRFERSISIWQGACPYCNRLERYVVAFHSSVQPTLLCGPIEPNRLSVGFSRSHSRLEGNTTKRNRRAYALAPNNPIDESAVLLYTYV